MAAQEKAPVPGTFIQRVLRLSSVRPKSGFAELSQADRRARIDYLWRKVRMVVKNRALWAAVQRDAWNKSRARFNLSDDSMLVGTDEEVEVAQKFQREDPRRATGLPWYIID